MCGGDGHWTATVLWPSRFPSSVPRRESRCCFSSGGRSWIFACGLDSALRGQLVETRRSGYWGSPASLIDRSISLVLPINVSIASTIPASPCFQQFRFCGSRTKSAGRFARTGTDNIREERLCLTVPVRRKRNSVSYLGADEEHSTNIACARRTVSEGFTERRDSLRLT